jgi:hypothetical protein
MLPPLSNARVPTSVIRHFFLLYEYLPQKHISGGKAGIIQDLWF